MIRKQDDFEKEREEDYEFAREKYHEIIKKTDTAIELMMNLAEESETPRVFEVLSTMLKQNADVTDRLMILQKEMNGLSAKDAKGQNGNNGGGNKTINNNVFVGSTSDLQRLIKQQMEGKVQEKVINDSKGNEYNLPSSQEIHDGDNDDDDEFEIIYDNSK